MTHSSLELDTSIEPLRVNICLKNGDSIYMSDNARIISYIGESAIPSRMLLVVEICHDIEHADTSGIKLIPSQKVNDNVVHPRRVKGSTSTILRIKML